MLIIGLIKDCFSIGWILLSGHSVGSLITEDSSMSHPRKQSLETMQRFVTQLKLYSIPRQLSLLLSLMHNGVTFSYARHDHLAFASKEFSTMFGCSLPSFVNLSLHSSSVMFHI